MTRLFPDVRCVEVNIKPTLSTLSSTVSSSRYLLCKKEHRDAPVSVSRFRVPLKVSGRVLKYNHRVNCNLLVDIMNKVISTEKHQFANCEVQKVGGQDEFVGFLSYRGFENGILNGDSLVAVRRQFQSICTLIDRDGGMLRRGSIMTGYHGDECKGDVLFPDGEIIGRWEMDAEDCCHFIPYGYEGPECIAPSQWMLQDDIARWLEGQNEA